MTVWMHATRDVARDAERVAVTRPTFSSAKEHSTKITRSSLDTSQGPGDWFTGLVFVDAVAAPEPPARTGAASVHFTHGARTHWHTHPFGQTIFVTEGIGRCQHEDGPVQEIRTGDRVFFEPGENHWHGAAPNRFMTHLAIQESDENGPVTWGDPLSDADYLAAARCRPATAISTPPRAIDALDRGADGRVGPNPDTYEGV